MKRDGDTEGKDYYFLSLGAFHEKISRGEFIEWEEVFEGRFYGTLFSEIERIRDKEDKHVLLDIDVQGAIRIKEKFPEAYIIFITPPSFDSLKDRLMNRQDNVLVSEKLIRLQKAPEEIRIGLEKCQAGVFSVVIVNNELEVAKRTILTIIKLFIGMKVCKEYIFHVRV